MRSKQCEEPMKVYALHRGAPKFSRYCLAAPMSRPNRSHTVLGVHMSLETHNTGQYFLFPNPLTFGCSDLTALSPTATSNEVCVSTCRSTGCPESKLLVQVHWCFQSFLSNFCECFYSSCGLPTSGHSLHPSKPLACSSQNSDTDLNTSSVEP